MSAHETACMSFHPNSTSKSVARSCSRRFRIFRFSILREYQASSECGATHLVQDKHNTPVATRPAPACLKPAGHKRYAHIMLLLENIYTLATVVSMAANHSLCSHSQSRCTTTRLP